MTTPVPLSEFALYALRSIESRPAPAQRFNPGVNRKLVEAGLAHYVMLPSPYERTAGTSISHLEITIGGTERLRIERAAR